MKKQPLISVIVPVYNVENYLPRCLDSIINQTYTNLEILLIDDGATDNSGKICDEYAQKDKRIRVFHKENGGLASARNCGLDNCSGEYISFVDSDDYILDRMYETLLMRGIQTDADIVIFGYISKTDLKEVRNEPPDTYQTRIFSNQQIIESYLIEPYIGPFAWNKLFKATLFDSLRIPLVRYQEDAFTTPKLLMKSQKTVFVKDSFYIYYQRTNSLERGGVSPNETLFLQWTQELIDLVSSRYDYLEPVCEYVRIGVAAKVLYKILFYNELKKHKELYEQLNDLIVKGKDTYSLVREKFPETKNNYFNAYIEQILYNPKKFKRSARWKGFLYMVKKLFLKVIGK